jgi:hypothetical protein
LETKEFYIKDSLINMLKTLDSQIAFVAQLAGDVSALKVVVSQMSPEVGKALAEQIKAQSDKFGKVVESQKMILEALRQGISKIPN